MTLTTGIRRVVTTLVLLGLMAVAPGCGGSESRKDRHIEQGKQFLAERNFTKARLEFRNALQIDPKDAEVRALAGLAAENLGEFNDAVKMYRVALAANKDLVLARSRLARIMALAGLSDEALDLLAPGLESTPGSADLLSVRAIVRGQQGDLAGASKDAELAVKNAPDNPDAIAALASVRWQQERRDEAIALLQRGVESNPGSVELRMLLVRLLVAMDKPEDAASRLEEVVRLEPRKIDYRYLLGQIYLSLGQADKAFSVAEGAVDANPGDVDAKIAFVQLLAAHRSFEAAEQQLGLYRKDSPKDLALLLATGRFYEGNGRQEEAERVYKELIERAGQNPQGLEARSRLAALMLRDGHLDEASELVEQVLKTNRSDAEALAARSEIALQRGDTAAAVADLRTAFGNQPDSVRLAGALARAHMQAGQGELAEQALRSVVQANPRDVHARFALAQFFIETGRPARARPVLEQLVAEEPNNLMALEGLVRLQLADKDPGAALKTAGAMQAIQPRSAKGFILAGQAYVAGQQFDAARKAYEQAGAADPRSVEPVLALSKLDVAQGQPQQALDRLDASLALAPDNGLLYAMRGDVLFSMRRPADAAESYAAAIKATPGWVQLYRALANALVAAGQPDRAIAILKDGLSATRESPWLALDLALLYSRLDQIDNAVGVYERMLARDPREMGAANNLAMLLVTKPRDEKSLGRAVALVQRFAKSENPAYLDTYGWVMFKAGKNPEALAALERAVAKAPYAKEVRYHLAMAQLKAGDLDNARKNLQEAIAGKQSYPGVDEARAALAAL